MTRAFAFRKDGRFEALLTGLKLGRTILQAKLASGWAARITLVNHPLSGPIFSGPQLQPWACQAGATDKQCDQPATFTYLYKSTNPAATGLTAYDPAHPASDVAQTTTDQGVQVPFIVRVETGYMDRDQYQIAALDQPGKPWTAVAPQAQFDHKLLITHGASCAVDYTTGAAPGTTGTATDQTALGKGFIVMSTALDNSGHNCNLALQAESLVMAKEHVIKAYGTLRYTIGTGCSGGSLAEQWIANAYPGVYQGILPTCSFPDAYSTATQFLDYHLLLAYFTHPTKWATGVVWLPTQMNDVLGGPGDGVTNAEVSDHAQFHVAVPTDPCNGTTTADRYNPISNPGGVRCTITDAAINVFGPDPAALWSAQERAAHRGFARLPVDNVGVEYGLKALEAGQITAAQFVDLNAAAGGADIDANPTTARVDATGSPSLARAYRSGMINETNNLNQTAIIDCRGPNPGLFHDAYRAFAVRARLDREHGTHANQLIWEGPLTIEADRDCELNSFIAMDGWLSRVQQDHSRRALPQKVIRDKPTHPHRRMLGRRWPQAVQHVSARPASSTSRARRARWPGTRSPPTRTSASSSRSRARTSPGSRSPAREWTTLQQTFAKGVCDFSRPGVDQQPTIPWLTYQDSHGRVIYGGRPLGRAPASREFRS